MKTDSLTHHDVVEVLVRACNFVENGYRWKSVLQLPYEDRLPWIRREFSNGGTYGDVVAFDGFRREGRGRGLWAQVEDRSGVISWQQILNFIEASEKFSHVCATCGAVVEAISRPATECRICWSENLIADPSPSIDVYAPAAQTGVATSQSQLALF